MSTMFADAPTSIEIRDEHGRKHLFPSRGDYIIFLIRLGLISDEKKFSGDAELVKAVYLDWLRRGQVGCLFAQLLGRQRSRTRVRTVVLRGAGDSETAAAELADDINSNVRSAIEESRTEAITILLPDLLSIEPVVHILQSLSTLPDWKAQSIMRWGGTLLSVGLRVHIEGATWAEVLGMGPFVQYLPPTRQCPVTSLELRTKAKGAHRSKIDPRSRSAFLADIPAESFLGKRQFRPLSKVFTPRQRLRILGHDDRRAKARVTFTVPEVIWNDFLRSGSRQIGVKD